MKHTFKKTILASILAVASFAANAGGYFPPTGSNSGLIVGTSTVTGGTTTRILYDNAGAIGEYVISGSGSVCMSTSCVMTTPNIGSATGNISGNAATVTTNANLTGPVTSTGNATVLSVAHCVAASDETTDLTTGTAKVTFRMPFAMTLTAVRGSLSTVATGATLLTVDVNEAGTTILSTKLTFDASESTTTTAATPPVISDSALADDAAMTIDIDAVGNTTAGKGLKVCLIGTRP